MPKPKLLEEEDRGTQVEVAPQRASLAWEYREHTQQSAGLPGGCARSLGGHWVPPTAICVLLGVHASLDPTYSATQQCTLRLYSWLVTQHFCSWYIHGGNRS